MTLSIGPLRIGLAAYSFPWRCGFIGQGTGRVCPKPFSANDLLQLGATYSLGMVELPLNMLPDLEPATLQAFRTKAESLGLQLVIDSGVVDVPTLERFIPAAAALGARVIRVMLSNILEGARFRIEGGWEAHLNEMIARLRYLRPLAEQYRVCLAPENHQDTTSADLLRVCQEVGGDYIGVTLDAVNPLAVGEDPLAFARALAPHIVNVHLKDYWIYTTDSGYRLVRCALGEGVLDLPAVFELLATRSPRPTCNIELAALYARHIRVYEDEWWSGYGPREARELIAALRLVQHSARSSDEDWRTPWERGAEAAVLAEYEEGQLARSIEYLRTIANRR